MNSNRSHSDDIGWFALAKAEAPARPPLSADRDVDLCVIGAGVAGLTVAREAARRGCSVAILEASGVASHASGRSTGVVIPGYGAPARTIVSRVGDDGARRLWDLSEQGAEYVRSAIRDDRIAGADLSEDGWLHISRIDDATALQSEAEFLTRTVGAAVESWPTERVREILRSPQYFGGHFYPRGFCIHPLNYALGLAAAAERAGARIYENCTVVDIDPVGVRKRIYTEHATLRTQHIVLAANIHSAGLMPRFSGTLLPIHYNAIVTAPLGDALRDAVSFAGAVSDTAIADCYYRVVDGDRLMWSGRSLAWPRYPQRQTKAIVRRMTQIFPQLGKIEVAHAWNGVVGNTVHRMPQIGEIAPGLWILSGFGERGLATTAMAGQIVTRAILDGDRTWELFSPFALVWSGGWYGRIAEQVANWSRRMSESIGGRLARRREERQRAIAGKAQAEG